MALQKKEEERRNNLFKPALSGDFNHEILKTENCSQKQDNTWKLRKVSGTYISTCFLKRKIGSAQSKPLSIPVAENEVAVKCSTVQ